MLRKILAILSVFLMVISSTCISFADGYDIDYDKAYKSTSTYSEYDIVKSLQALSDEQLKERGMNEAEIENIREANITEKSAAKVTYAITWSNFKTQNGKTYISTKMTWSWNKSPACLYTDIVAMTTSSEFVKNDASGYVVYYVGGDKTKAKQVLYPAIKTKSSGKCVYYTFNMGREKSSAAGYKYRATNGQIEADWIISGTKNVVGVSGNYAHAILSCDPSVSLGAGGVSLSFTPKVSLDVNEEVYKKAEK